MNIQLDDDDDFSGALVRGGDFGESRLSAYDSIPLYFAKTNPNLVVGGVLCLGGIGLLALLVMGLGSANPNNQLLESQAATSQAYSKALEATTDAVKAAVNQRPTCAALVCVMHPEPSPAPSPSYSPVPAPYYELPRNDSAPYIPTPVVPPVQPSPDLLPVPAVPGTYAAQTAIGTFEPTRPDWWVHQWQTNPQYVRESIHFCNTNGWGRSECQALSTLMQ